MRLSPRDGWRTRRIRIWASRRSRSCWTRSNGCGESSCRDDPLLGASTLNIGTIQGGRAPNVIPDHASAEIFIRLVDSGDSFRAAIAEAAEGLAEAHEVLCIPALHLGALDGFKTHGGLLHHRYSRLRRTRGAGRF